MRKLVPLKQANGVTHCGGICEAIAASHGKFETKSAENQSSQDGNVGESKGNWDTIQAIPQYLTMEQNAKGDGAQRTMKHNAR